MALLSRREFFKKTATDTVVAGLVAAGVAELAAAPFGWPIGCQTFPVGKMIDQDFPGTMKQLADAGFQRIELCSPWYAEHNFGFGSLNKITATEFRKTLGDVG